MAIVKSLTRIISILASLVVLTITGLSCTQPPAESHIDVEIKLAPIDEVKVNLLKSNPPQIGVYIKGGLPDGCTTFHDIETAREGSTVNIKVTVQRPRGVSCPAIYTNFEKDVNLGSDFAFGTTYTLNVNDYTTTFEGTLDER